MAATAKYQRVSAEDHDDVGSSYTQAPPSYQAESASQGLLGAPRTENDNLPDDFKVCILIYGV
jgi:protein lifeguard